MIYANDLPSTIVLMETYLRLSQLGCAVTAGKETASRENRAGKSQREYQSVCASGFALANGKGLDA